MDGWISVENSLPIYTGYYNVICNICSMLGGWNEVRSYRYEIVDGCKLGWLIPDRFDEVVSVTHWRNLPSLPKELDCDD